MRMHWCSEQVHTGSVSQGKIRVLKTVQIMGWCADSPLGSSIDLLRAANLPSYSNNCYSHCVCANHIPNVSLAEGVHIGTRSATSAVRVSLSHKESSIDFHRIQKLRARRRNIVLLLAAFGTMCDSSPLPGRSTCRS